MGDEFFSLVISVAKFMYQKYDVGGLSIKINFMDLPIGVGLSSSSAIAVLVVKSFNLIYKLNLNDYEVMDDAYNSERNAGFKCGRMDHICTFSKKLLLMEFDEKLNIKEIIPKKKIHLVFCIIQKKDTKKILELLNKSYPIALSKKDSLIQNSLGIKNKKIVYEAIEYIESGNYKKLGMLMKKSQNYFDKEVFLGTDFDEIKLKQIISDDTISSLILGAKGVGSHGDGAVQFLVQSSKKQNELIKRIKELGYNAYKFDI